MMTVSDIRYLDNNNNAESNMRAGGEGGKSSLQLPSILGNNSGKYYN